MSTCGVCQIQVEPSTAVTAFGKQFHKPCNVCCQCFCTFNANNLMFEFEGRAYCKADYWQLYGPRCGNCGEDVVGETVKALGKYYHKDHFTCEVCNILLVGKGFAKKADRPMCQPCFKQATASNKKEGTPCAQCGEPVIPEHILVVKGVRYHANHFKCDFPSCDRILDSKAVEKDNRLYCKTCFAKISSYKFCTVCREVIEGRAITAIGKSYHPHHFICSKCEINLTQEGFAEHNGMPLCKTCYSITCPDLCMYCKLPAVGANRIEALGHLYCQEHFRCYVCDQQLRNFQDVDNKPICINCWPSLPPVVKLNNEKIKKAEASIVKNRAANK